MGQFHERQFPGESADYREARDRLLSAERDLRRQVAAVADLRRELPPGGAPPQDYVFEEGPADLSDDDKLVRTRLSELFAPGLDTLAVYSFMYAPDGEPCPMCTAFLDSLNGSARHMRQRVNLAVVAKAPIGDIRRFARGRGWGDLRLLSSGGNRYNADYFAETPDGSQWPLLNVFRRTQDGIRHTYGTELFFVAPEEGQHPRHIDALWPLWNLFDMTPEGRGTDWWPRPSYD